MAEPKRRLVARSRSRSRPRPRTVSTSRPVDAISPELTASSSPRARQRSTSAAKPKQQAHKSWCSFYAFKKPLGIAAAVVFLLTHLFTILNYSQIALAGALLAPVSSLLRDGVYRYNADNSSTSIFARPVGNLEHYENMANSVRPLLHLGRRDLTLEATVRLRQTQQWATWPRVFKDNGVIEVPQALAQDWSAYEKLFIQATLVHDLASNLSASDTTSMLSNVQLRMNCGLGRISVSGDSVDIQIPLQSLRRIEVFEYRSHDSPIVAAVARLTLLGAPRKEHTIHYFLERWSQNIEKLYLETSETLRCIEHAQSTLDQFVAEFKEFDRVTEVAFEAVKASCAEIDRRRWWWERTAAEQYMIPCLTDGLYGTRPFYRSKPSTVLELANRSTEVLVEAKLAFGAYVAELQDIRNKLRNVVKLKRDAKAEGNPLTLDNIEHFQEVISEQAELALQLVMADSVRREKEYEKQAVEMEALVSKNKKREQDNEAKI